MTSLNVKIADEIEEHLQGKQKSIDYLVDILHIGKESAYRRLKNQVPFTFEEIARIAQDLNFSIDGLLKKSNNSHIYNISIDTSQDPSKIYINMLEQTAHIMKELNASRKLNIVGAINRIPFRFFPFKILFKYEYYNYLYSNGYLPLTTRLADISIDPKIEQLQEEIAYYFSHFKNVTCIFDHYLFNKFFLEVHYSYKLGNLSDEDIRALQSESFEMLAMLETMLRTGKNNLNNDYTFYYSSQSIDSNCFYYEYDNSVMLQIWLFHENPIVILNNQHLCFLQKRWLDANIRHSILITKSNNALQLELIKKIHNQISDLQK